MLRLVGDELIELKKIFQESKENRWMIEVYKDAEKLIPKFAIQFPFQTIERIRDEQQTQNI